MTNHESSIIHYHETIKLLDLSTQWFSIRIFIGWDVESEMLRMRWKWDMRVEKYTSIIALNLSNIGSLIMKLKVRIPKFALLFFE